MGINTDLPTDKIVMVHGNFNIVHPGHLRLLHFAKSCGDVLLVGLLENNAGSFVDYKDREATLMASDCVDRVEKIKLDQLTDFIRRTKPSILVKGKEHENSENLEKNVLAEVGGKLIFASGEIQFSSRDLIRKELIDQPRINLKRAKNFVLKHKINLVDLNDRLSEFASISALIIGDVILDEYVYCDPLGMSQEDPTIVVTPIEKQFFLGGAGIVAAHMKSLGADAYFLSVVGRDDISNKVRDSLNDYSVKHFLAVDESRPTIRKQRFKSGGKTLLRVSHLRSHDIGEEQANDILHNFVRLIDDVNVVVFSDFNYGCLPQRLVDVLIQVCKEKGKLYFVDSQASSQIGNVSRFKGANFISATEREARLALNDFKSGLQSVSDQLMGISGSKNLILKLGGDGLLALEGNPIFKTDSLPTLNQNPVDVSGAGDALLSAASLYFGLDQNIWTASLIGSVAAGIQVSRPGNIPLQLNDLINQLEVMQSLLP